MAFESNSPNMLLPVPGVGQTNGPQFATDVNNCLTLIDSHDHSPGKGVPISPSGMNINSDLTFADNNAINLRSARFQVQPAALSGSADLDCLYVTGVDLYYNDGVGNVVRITQSGGVAGSPGSIANLTSPASASYVSANSTFVWQSAANTPADMDFASAIFRNLTANSHGLTLQPPAAMGADYTLTLPTLPSVQSFMTLDAAGNMAAPWTVDNSTIVVSGNEVQIPANVSLPGKNASVVGQDIVSSNTNPATNGLSIVRGFVNAGGSIGGGEGFSVSNPATGVYVITFTTPFLSGDRPCVTVTPEVSGGAFRICVLQTAPDLNGFQVVTYDGAQVVIDDTNFSFIAIAQRA